MRKNKMMRLASALLVAVLLTTCAISGTFAKYTTSVTSQDAARVAYWGFQKTNSMDLTNLFLSTYTNVASEDGKDVIAPGTNGSASFQFKYDETAGTAPEVAYTFEVAVVDSCDDAIKNNVNILWSLDGTEYVTDASGKSWDKMVAAIKALAGDESGSKQYAPGELPTAFTAADNTHTISWRWIFTNSDANDGVDTDMGNAADLADCSIKITITATQVD